MLHSGSSELNLAGELQVEKWLLENGYSNVLKKTLQLHEHGLVATGRVETILVQVRTFLHPNRPFKLSDYEIDILTRRAAKLKLVPYAAYIVMDKNGTQAEDIVWERLSQ